MSRINDLDLSFTVGDVEVTLREIIFSVTIAAVLFLVGFLISSKIEHHVNQRNLQYRQASQIPSNNTNEFALAMRTDVGNAFVEGRFSAVDRVKHEKLKGEWTKIYADHQRYTRHSRTVHYTTTDSKGRTHHHTRVEHYWTWDTYNTENFHAKQVRYIGSVFAYDKFDYSDVRRHYETVDNGFRQRIEFTCIPAGFNAAAYTKLENGTVANGTSLHQGVKIPDLYKYMTTSYAVTIFWSVWGVFIVGAVIMFVCLENNWVEDKKEDHIRSYGYGDYSRKRVQGGQVWRPGNVRSSKRPWDVY